MGQAVVSAVLLFGALLGEGGGETSVCFCVGEQGVGTVVVVAACREVVAVLEDAELFACDVELCLISVTRYGFACVLPAYIWGSAVDLGDPVERHPRVRSAAVVGLMCRSSRIVVGVWRRCVECRKCCNL